VFVTRVDDTVPSELLDRAVRLREDVELLEGAHGSPMLYVSGTESYVRLGRAAVLVLPLLDGSRTGGQVARELAVHLAAPDEVARRQVDALLGQLRQASLLSGLAPAGLGRRERVADAMRRTPMKRLPLRWVVAPLRRFAGAPVGARGIRLASAAGVLCLAFGVAAWLLSVLVSPPIEVRALIPAFALLLIQILGHEATHAAVLTLLGVPPREVGIALWYYVLPVVYVDRTDSYRVSSRLGQFAVPAAGPMHDLVWLFAAAVVTTQTTGFTQQVASALFYLQATMLLAGANPFLPTDGYQMLEALLGETNLRGRALSLVAYRLLRRPLPPQLAALTRRRRLAYLGYGLACLVYLGWLVVAIYLWVGALTGFTAVLT
jgi:putative peptide zinc metalloprotease protein